MFVMGSFYTRVCGGLRDSTREKGGGRKREERGRTPENARRTRGERTENAWRTLNLGHGVYVWKDTGKKLRDS